MSIEAVINNQIEKKLLDMHTAYLAKILAVNGNTAKIQPLGMIKQVGGAAFPQAILTSVPIAANCNKISVEEITYIKSVNFDTKKAETETKKIAVIDPLKEGDIAICICCDRDITEAKRGVNAALPAGHHNISSSIIIGVL